jgi:hypothetical protein
MDRQHESLLLIRTTIQQFTPPKAEHEEAIKRYVNRFNIGQKARYNLSLQSEMYAIRHDLKVLEPLVSQLIALNTLYLTLHQKVMATINIEKCQEKRCATTIIAIKERHYKGVTSLVENVSSGTLEDVKKVAQEITRLKELYREKENALVFLRQETKDRIVALFFDTYLCLYYSPSFKDWGCLPRSALALIVDYRIRMLCDALILLDKKTVSEVLNTLEIRTRDAQK